MVLDTSAITQEIAHQVLWCYGLAETTDEYVVGYQPGGFVEQLLRAIGKADHRNRLKLALGFPGHVAACWLVELQENGAAQLREIALGTTP